MPAPLRITRDMILTAALRIVRTQGHEALTARRLAASLDCSTQPILYQFGSVSDIIDEVYRVADGRHTAYLTENLEGEAEPLLALGLRYIRFGAEEPRLFRFLFQSDRFKGLSWREVTCGEDASGLIAIVSAQSGLPPTRAAELFQGLFVAVHGYASLLANNAMRWDEREAGALLRRLYEALLKEENHP